MGSRELIEGLLWRARAGVRVEGVALRAGHGMADAAYRPPALPYASVVGPLNIELEPERDQPRTVFLPVQTPGYLAGADRTAGDAVPGPGPLTLRIDGDLVLAADVDFGGLAGRALTDEGVGQDAATRLEESIRGGAATVDGAAATDPERLAELADVTARWDVPRRRVVIASGRRGVVTGSDLLAQQPSAVELVAPAGAVATALGLDAPTAVTAPGRVVRHRRPAPIAVAVDVRVDLWASTQSELAAVLDAWTRSTATRGQLLVRPALLAEDVAPTDTSVRLLAPAEPPARTTIALLGAVGAEFLERRTGRAARLTAGAQVLDRRLDLTGGGRAQLDLLELPPVPVAWVPDSPATHGYAATVGVRLAPGAAGEAARVLTLLHDGRTALRLDVAFVGTGAELRASAMRADAGSFPPVSAPVTVAALDAGLDVHVALDARRGRLTLAIDGETVAAGAAGAGGMPVSGAGMRLVLGPPEGSPGNPVDVAVRHLHLHGAPVGAPDPRLGQAAAPASAWAPGDPFVLARSTDGVTSVGDGVAASVVGVQGDRVLLDRPVQASFRRTESIAYLRSEFFSQRVLRRSDDLMNQLYRMSAEYRVSTVLDELDSGVSAPLAETVDLQLRDFARLAAELASPDAEPFAGARAATGSPGTTALFTTNPPRSTSSTHPPDSMEESHG